MLFKNKQRLFIVSIMLLASWQIITGSYIQVKAYVAQQLLLKAWDKTLAGDKKVKPWSWADTWPVARLQVPALNEDIIILAGDSGRNLAFGPGYRFGTAQPGMPGVSIISAHRDTHFRFLRNIKRGDEIRIQTDKGQIIHYKVSKISIVDKAQAQIEPVTTTSELLLVTCYPFNAVKPGTRLRYLVFATQNHKPS